MTLTQQTVSHFEKVRKDGCVKIFFEGPRVARLIVRLQGEKDARKGLYVEATVDVILQHHFVGTLSMRRLGGREADDGCVEHRADAGKLGGAKIAEVVVLRTLCPLGYGFECGVDLSDGVDILIH